MPSKILGEQTYSRQLQVDKIVLVENKINEIAEQEDRLRDEFLKFLEEHGLQQSKYGMIRSK